MAEYIKRQDAIDEILRHGSTGNYDLNNGLIMAVNAVHSVPTAGVVPVVHGKWVYKPLDKFRKYQVKCSNCDIAFIGNYDAYDEPGDFNYCPNCGAKMDEVNDGEVR